MPTDEPSSRLAWSIPHAAQRLDLGRSTVWQLVRSGQLKSFRVERRVLIPESELIRFIEERFQ